MGGKDDHRDFAEGQDENEVLRIECLKEVMALLQGKEENKITENELAETTKKLKGSRLLSLTEFGRAIHAEMEAILSASRNGVSVKDAFLFSTTFPCHNCAKHIVGAGIRRVVYVEPYSKSLAKRLHGDAISFLDEKALEGKITFEPFSGISHRRYSFLFSNFSDPEEPMVRKDDMGKLSQADPRLRLRGSHLSHVEKENLAVHYANELIKNFNKSTE